MATPTAPGPTHPPDKEVVLYSEVNVNEVSQFVVSWICDLDQLVVSWGADLLI